MIRPDGDGLPSPSVRAGTPVHRPSSVLGQTASQSIGARRLQKAGGGFKGCKRYLCVLVRLSHAQHCKLCLGPQSKIDGKGYKGNCQAYSEAAR